MSDNIRELHDITERMGGHGAAAAYAEHLVSAIRSLESVSGITPSEFKNAARKIIQNVLDFTASNPLLTDEDKQQVNDIVLDMERYVSRRTAFSTRLSRTVQSVRSLASRTRSGLAEEFLNTNDIISQGIGILLSKIGNRGDRKREIAGIQKETAIQTAGVDGASPTSVTRMGSNLLQYGGELEFISLQREILKELQLIRKGDEKRDEQSEIASELGQDIYRDDTASVKTSPTRLQSNAPPPAGDPSAPPAGGPSVPPGAKRAMWSVVKRAGKWMVGGARWLGSGLAGSSFAPALAFGTGAAAGAALFAGAFKVIGEGPLFGPSILRKAQEYNKKAGQEVISLSGGMLDISKRIRAYEREQGLTLSKQGKVVGYDDTSRMPWIIAENESDPRLQDTPKKTTPASTSTPASTTEPIRASSSGLVQGETFAEGAFADAAPLKSLGAGRALPSVPTITSRTASPTRIGQPTEMTPSSKFFDMLESFEGFRATPYADAGGVWTVGYGSTTWNGKRVTATYPSSPVTREDARAETLKHVGKFANDVNKKLKVPVDQAQFDALVSVAYNKGNADDLIGKLNRGESVEYEDFAKSATIKGQRGRDIGQYGLELRRAKEYALFSGNEQLVQSMGRGKGAHQYARFQTALTTSRSAVPVAAGTTQLAAAQTAAPVVMMVNASRGTAATPPQPMPVPLPVRPRDPSMEPLSRV